MSQQLFFPIHICDYRRFKKVFIYSSLSTEIRTNNKVIWKHVKLDKEHLQYYEGIQRIFNVSKRTSDCSAAYMVDWVSTCFSLHCIDIIFLFAKARRVSEIFPRIIKLFDVVLSCLGFSRGLRASKARRNFLIKRIFSSLWIILLLHDSVTHQSQMVYIFYTDNFWNVKWRYTILYNSVNKI